MPMKLVTVRLEENIRNIIEEYSKIYNIKTSEIARDLVQIGVKRRKQGKAEIIGPLNIKIPIENISLDEKNTRITFYIDEKILRDATETFNDEEQSVIRKALRLALFELDNISQIKKLVEADKNQTNYDDTTTQAALYSSPLHYSMLKTYRYRFDNLTKFNKLGLLATHRQPLYQLISDLSPENPEKTILLTGPFGSGKTHLAKFIAQLASTGDHLDLLPPEMRADAEKIAGKYRVEWIDAAEHVQHPTSEEDETLEENNTERNNSDKIKPILQIIELGKKYDLKQLIENRRYTKQLITFTELQQTEVLREIRKPHLTINLSGNQ